MKDLNQVINGLTQSGLLSGLAGGLAGGTLVGALSSKKGRKMGKSALKVGALAVVGGVAWKAYQSYSQRNSAAVAQPQATSMAAGSGSADAPASITRQRFEAVVDDTPTNPGQMLLLRAMIAAAYADGHIDAEEKQRIFAQVEEMDLSTADKAALFDELQRPLAVDALIKLVPNTETCIEVYAASVLVIDETQAESRRYLGQLADGLRFPDELVSSLHSEVGALKTAH